MSNSSSSNDLTWAQNEIDDLWNSINSSRSDPFSFWVLFASFIFALLGSLSNLMSVIVLLKLSTHLSTFVYLTSLSISDMITCITIMIAHILEYLLQTRRSTSIAIFLRQIEILCGALAAGSRVLSFWISTAVTMDRWLLICYPLYGKTFCTLNRARIVSRTLFIIAFIYSVPLFFEYEIVRIPSVYQMIHIDNESITLMDDKLTKHSMFITKGYTDLAKRRLYRWSYMFFNALFVYTLPVLTIVFFNFQLIRALHRLKSRAKRLRQKHSTKYSEKTSQHRHHHRRLFHRSKYSVTVMVIAMVLTLLLCRSPTIVLWVLWSFELTIKIFFDSSSNSLVVRRFHNLANLIAIINAATNFIPFCVFGQLFRDECLTIYCCRKPTSEQLARQAKQKYQERYLHLKRNSRTRLVNHEIQTTQSTKDYLRTVPSFNSDSTTGVTPSSNDQNMITNILRLSDPPVSLDGNLQQVRLSLNTTIQFNETSAL
ncbi:unnamed protein product [Adineta steineri]|uniref:G-protein coupled receptors family 1 profile domain-containing protein n=1 Tax=Adineta steineri TaxID=433720 RepID=A0A815P7C9_9BILA|nr:unnamed protein product [Adineta steineri]